MQSPISPDAKLVEVKLDDGLRVMRCKASSGIWLRPAAYWQWREGHRTVGGEASAHDQPAGEDVPASDSGAGKLCPEDGHFLIRHCVGHGLDFHIDRCGHCGGMWFDAGEWEAMGREGLQTKLHLVFSSAWQAQVRAEEARRARHAMLADKLGEDDYREVRRIAQWIEDHPKRNELLAYLRSEFAETADRQ